MIRRALISPLALAICAAAWAATAARAGTPEAMSLIKTRCLACHSEEKSKGGLALTSRQAALRGGDDGPAIRPGNAAASRLIQVIQPGSEPHMPPKDQLTPRAIRDFEDWINAGAVWDASLLTERDAPPPEQLGTLPPGYAPVLAVALTPDGRKLAVGSGQRVVIYDILAETNRHRVTLEGHRDAVQSLAWSTNGQRLASGGYRHVMLWDAQSNATQQWPTPAGRVTALAFAPDGGTLFAGESASGGAGWIRAWRVQDAARVAEWSAHGDSIYSLAVSRDGQRLASAGGDRLAKIWQWPSRRLEGLLEGHGGAVYGVVLSRDGLKAATAGADKLVMLWDVSTRLKLTQITNTGGVTALGWSADDTLLATASEDGVARTFTNFTSHSGEQSSGTATERRLGGAGALLTVSVSADGKRVASGAHDGTVWLWNEGKLISKWKP